MMTFHEEAMKQLDKATRNVERVSGELILLRAFFITAVVIWIMKWVGHAFA